MRIRTLLAALAVALVAAAPGLAQSSKKLTADQVIERYLKAIGGTKALEARKSYAFKGTIEVLNAGLKGTIEVYGAAPNRFASVTQLAGVGRLAQVFDGSRAWGADPFNGVRELTGVEGSMLRRQAQFNAELKWRDLWKSIEVVDAPAPAAGGRPVVALKLTPPDGEGHPVTNYYDAETFLLVRSETVVETSQATTPVVTTLSDYREVGGIKVPFVTEQQMPTASLRVTFTEAAFDVKIDDAKFAKPQ
jgi:hypothetical protein